jgi:hypothetical protein
VLQIAETYIFEGVTVYGDHEGLGTYYLLPQQARFRLDEKGEPVFKFIKYRFPVDREDGRKGGGFLIFDAEFVVPEDKVERIKEALVPITRDKAARAGVEPPPVTVGSLTYTDGSVKVNLFNESEELVEAVFNPGKPSLFGNNVSSFSVELTPEGAALAEDALQGRGGVVQVAYSLVFWAKLPPLKVTARFNSSQFYSFFQDIDVDWHMWAEDSYRETVREQLIESQSMVVEVDQGGVTDTNLIAEVKDWAFRTLEKYVEKKMIEELAPATEDQRKIPDGIEDVTRDISNTHVSSFTFNYKESATAEWDVHPPGTLPNITSLTDAQGNPLKWEDFSVLADLDDEFFKQLRVDVSVNADFATLPIHSVEVKVNYKGQPMAALAAGPEGEASFEDADKIAKFAAFVDGDVDDEANWKYSYSYQVNYKGTSKTFQSEEVETDEGIITVGVDDVGILLVDVAAGDINFNDVQTAQVKLAYADEELGVGPIEEQFSLDAANKEHEFKRVIFQPFRKPYTYSVKYFLKDGREFSTSEQSGRAHNLFIHDPFSGSKAVKVLATGDLEKTIENIFVELEYVDDANQYRQTQSIVLNSETPFFDWTFPVIDDALGTVTYSGNIVLRNGTVRPIEETVAESGTIVVPKAPQEILDLQVITDLIDFSAVKLARVSIDYADDANFASLHKDLVFSKANSATSIVKIPIFDRTKKSVKWQASFFMTDNSRKTVPPTETTDSVVILEVPA